MRKKILNLFLVLCIIIAFTIIRTTDSAVVSIMALFAGFLAVMIMNDDGRI